MKVTLMLSVSAVLLSTGGIIDHNRRAACHNCAQHGEGASARCRQHDSNAAALEFSKAASKNQPGQQGLLEGYVATSCPVDKGDFFGRPSRGVYESML
jgi:hypothetical protein